MLWQNANADLPGCHAYRKGENGRSLITSDKQNPTAQPGTDCQIEFLLIHIILVLRHDQVRLVPDRHPLVLVQRQPLLRPTAA